MSAYYNEIEPYAAAWLRNLIAKGLIADGEVDSRSIVDVRPDDLRGYTQCHFFAGIGGWSYALRLAGWPDDSPVWTGSCPCQPFSVAGQGKGEADERDLWPVWSALIRKYKPPVVFGEQVAAAIGKHWLDRSRVDLEGAGYAFGSAVLPACAVGAPHRRDRLWFVADAEGVRRPREQGGVNAGRPLVGSGVGAGGRDGAWDSPTRSQFDGGDQGGPSRIAESGPLADASSERRHGREVATGGNDTGRKAAGRSEGADRPELRGEIALADADIPRQGEGREQRGGQQRRAGRDPWAGAVWLTGADGKARRVEPGIRLLAHGIPARVGKLPAYGNAIVPQVAAEFVAAYMDCRP